MDIIAAPPVPQLDMLDSGDTQVVPVKGGRIIIYLFNVSTRPFDNAKVREAVNLAVNSEAIVKSVLGGRGIVLAGSASRRPGSATTPSVKPHPVRSGAAPSSSWPRPATRRAFDTTWAISSGVFLKDTEIAEAVAGQLRQVGVRVKLVPTERAKIQKDAQEDTFQGMTSIAWGTQFEPDPMLNWVMPGRT